MLEGDIEVVARGRDVRARPRRRPDLRRRRPAHVAHRRRGADPLDPRARPPRPSKRGQLNALTPRRGRRPALHRHPHVRAGAARHRPPRTPTSPSSACRSTPRPRCAPARASARPASATRRCCCGRTTRRRTSTSSRALARRPRRPARRRRATRERTAEQIADAARARASRAGAIPLTLGGDHSIVLGELRAHAAVHGPVGVVLLDAHADTWEQYYGERYFHGTPFKRALEEGLIDPHRSLLAGHARVASTTPRTSTSRASWGFEIVTCDELRTWTPAQYAQRVRARIGDGPAFLSLRHRRIDPAFAPATGTPEVCGLLPHEAIAFLRALRGHRVHRLRPRRGRARLRHQRPDDRAAGGQHRLRVAHPDSTVSCVSASCGSAAGRARGRRR